MKLWSAIAFLLLPVGLLAQKNDVTLYAVGNINPTYSVYLGAYTRAGVPTGDTTRVVGGTKSAMGYGVEFRHNWNSAKKCYGAVVAVCNATGLDFDQNPSDGKLIVPPSWGQTTYIWPTMRYDLAVLETQQFNVGRRWSPYVNEGPGVILTNGYGNSGWSANPAGVVGWGVTYRLKSRWFARANQNFLIGKQGCYGDPTCASVQTMEQVVRVGVGGKW